MTKQTNNVSGKVVNSFLDRGDGVVDFPNGLVITDDSTMWSGTKYDIDTLDVSEYPGQLTLDHMDSIEDDCLIGKVEGVRKQGNKITVDRIRYAINISKNAMRAYQLLVGGFSNAFSIETVGPWADQETGIMSNHKLVGLSQVVMGNNKNAVANSITPMVKVQNGAASEDPERCVAVHEVHVEGESKPDEGETSVTEEVKDAPVEGEFIETPAETEEVVEELEGSKEPQEAPVKNDIEVEAEVEEQPETEDDNEAVEESEEETTEEAPVEEPAEKAEPETEATEEVETEEPAEEKAEVEEVDNEIAKSEAEEELEAEPAVPAEEEKETESEEAVADDTDEAESEQPAEEEVDNNNNNNKVENEMTKEEILKAINDAVSALNTTPAVEEPAKEEVTEEKVENEAYSLEKHANIALRAIKTKSARAYDELNAINQRNLDALKAEGKVSNTMTIEDWGNFVLPPEQLRQIVGKRTDYSAILNATQWVETNRLEFAWLTRDGDIDMQNVAMCESKSPLATGKENLKPISTYGAVQHIEQMEHLGAVTPICTAATKYLIVDLIADAIAGYRNNYDKKRAELVIAKLQEAVNIAGNKVNFDKTATDENKLKTFIAAIREISDSTTTGSFIFTQKTLLKIMEYVSVRQTALGDRVFDTGTDGIPRVFGTPYIVVPNSLMPSLDSTAANPVISYIPVDASSTVPQEIEITSTVFYGDLSQFVGYTSGGLNFTMDERVAYETPSGAVRSAFQRDEIVLRGFFFRGGAYRYPEAMAAITNEPVSS